MRGKTLGLRSFDPAKCAGSQDDNFRAEAISSSRAEIEEGFLCPPASPGFGMAGLGNWAGNRRRHAQPQRVGHPADYGRTDKVWVRITPQKRRRAAALQSYLEWGKSMWEGCRFWRLQSSR
jgi:hypothetical protein